MAFDGIVMANLVRECREKIVGGRISKITQPEKDEILLTIKGDGEPIRLLLSANASLPLVYLTKENKPSPLTAPNFCMLLRKHISGGRILSVTQPGLERCLHFTIEHRNELGDLCEKILIVEIMGKHSNLIFCDSDFRIIDSIKHVPSSVSTLREVLPGRTYFLPSALEKKDPYLTTTEELTTLFSATNAPVGKVLYTTFQGISPVMAGELCYRSGIDADASTAALNAEEQFHLANQFCLLMEEIKEGAFGPTLIFDGQEPLEFSAIPLTQYQDKQVLREESISVVLERFFAEKNTYTRIRQKSVDLRRIVSTALERNQKKYQLQRRQLQDTEKKDQYRTYGELLHIYGYSLQPGQKELVAEDYRTGNPVKIPLDPTKTAGENAQKFFDKYSKMKRTAEALTPLMEETREEILHLESISASLELALFEEDLIQIKEELVEYGYIRRRGPVKKEKSKSRRLSVVSREGCSIYVGKDNYRNGALTFRFAESGDWWFHVKGTAGSHVIVKTQGKELPDETFVEAARLAAYYSKSRGNDKVEVDYVQRKHIKKPGSAKPGFVVYYTNYSMVVPGTIAPETTSL